MTTRSIPWPRILAEGVAIVVSILLAFGIQAWWEGRLQRSAEADLLVALAAEFDANRTVIELRRGLYDRRFQAQLALLDVVRGAEVSADSVDMLLRSSLRTGYLDLADGARSSTIASGDLRLIRDLPLRSLLAQWPVTMSNLRELENQENDIVRDYIRPWLRERRGLPGGIGGQDYPSAGERRDYRTFLKDPEIDQLLMEASLFGPLIDRNMVQLLDAIDEIGGRIAGHP